jgi:hypothetical protein
MNDKETGLENFIERHRADFDVFEPRPDLWDDIEQNLAAPTAGAVAPAADEAPAVAPLRVVKLYPDEVPEAAPAAFVAPAPATFRSKWLPNSGMAAAVALLIAAGIGAVWSNNHQDTVWARTTGTTPLVLAPESESEDLNSGLYFGASPVANAPESSAQHLTTALERMEAYYATQIAERKGALRELEAQTTAASAPSADWRQELAGLDSTYRQLKVELYRNPEPDVVLEAMNRNLQIRLDILNQQTRSREQVQEYHAQPLMIADTHPMP